MWFIENRKKEFEDEKVPMPIIWTVIIAIAVIAILVVGVWKFTDAVDKYEMQQQYGVQYEEVV